MENYYCGNNIRLDQYIIIDKEDKGDVIRCWDRCYTKEMMKNELEKAGFRNIKIYSDVCGKAYDEESKTISVVAEK